VSLDHEGESLEALAAWAPRFADASFEFARWFRLTDPKSVVILVSRLGFEPRTRGLEVPRAGVHAVVLGHPA
jgi:hypothetical protein